MKGSRRGRPKNRGTNIAKNPKPHPHYLSYLNLEARQALTGIAQKESLELEILRDAFEHQGISVSQLRKDWDLNKSLLVLENYSAGIKNPPFSGDLGAGTSKAMAPRYYSKGAIMAAAGDLQSALCDAYVKLVLAFADPETIHFSEEDFGSKMDHALAYRYPEYYRLKARKPFWNAFVEILKQHANEAFNPDTFTPADALKDYQFDSIDYLELAQEFEDFYGIELPLEELEAMECTIGGLARLWEQKLFPPKAVISKESPKRIRPQKKGLFRFF